MNYHSGRMGIAEGIGLAYSVSFPLVFLSTPSLLVESAGTLSWATPITGGLAAGVLLWIQLSLLEGYSGDLLELSEHLLGKPAAYALGLFYFFAMFATACIWTREFAENTLLTALPYAKFQNVIFIYGFTVLVLLYLGIEALSRTCYILLPIVMGGLLLVLVGITPITEPLYLFPLLGNGLPSLIKPTLRFVGASSTIAILMILAPSFQNTKAIKIAVIFGFGSSVLIRSAANAIYVATFSSVIASEKLLPFYEMARLIYINRYVQRLEALFTAIWVIVGVLGIAICLYGSLYIIARLCKLPTPVPLLLPMGLIMINLASIPSDTGEIFLLSSIIFSNILAFGFVITTLALLIAALMKRGRKKECDIT